MSRGIEAEILPAVRELGISVTAYGILSRGLLNRDTARLGRRRPAGPVPPVPGRQPGAQPEPCWTRWRRSREERGVSTAQLAIAWVAAQGEDIIPLIGTKRRYRLAEALAALDLRLTPDELAAIGAAVPAGQVAGTRYDAAQMGALDSER